MLCRFTTEPHSWRAMLMKADRAQSELLAHKDFPVDDLRREMGDLRSDLTQVALAVGARQRANRNR